MIAADQATGCFEHPAGIGRAFDTTGAEITDERARELVRNGRKVAFPNAGAGSYPEVFRRLGYPKVRVLDQTSSAGDWIVEVHDGECWFHAYQENRHPNFGFVYWVYVKVAEYDPE